jgi:hypothetical protein
VDALPRGADVEVAWIAAGPSHGGGLPALATPMAVARAGSALVGLSGVYDAATPNDALVPHAVLDAIVAAAAPPAVTLVQVWVYVPPAGHAAAGLWTAAATSRRVPLAVVPVRALEPGVRLAWVAWGERAVPEEAD